MDFWQAILLSAIEGTTEFLPVSSTGHLILASEVLNIPQTNFVKSFEIFIQPGAILAVVVLYFKKYAQNMAVWKNVLTAFAATSVVAFPLYRLIKDQLIGNPLITLVALFLGGVALIVLEKVYQEESHHVEKIEKLTLRQSALIGLAQSLSVIPGVSRSAATILGGMFLGAKRETAAEFSFLLAVPTMAAAVGLDLKEQNFQFSPAEWQVLGAGFIGSFLVALTVVKWFVKYVQTNNFIWFGVYRIVVAILFWLIILR